MEGEKGRSLEEDVSIQDGQRRIAFDRKKEAGAKLAAFSRVDE